MFDQKDLIRINSVITKLMKKCKFNDMDAEDVVHLHADFAWLDELKKKVISDLQRQQAEAAKQQALDNAMAQAEIPNNESEGEISEGFGEEEKPAKKKRTRKTKKKTTKKS